MSAFQALEIKPFCSINESVDTERGDFGFYEDLPYLIWLFGNITVWQPTKDLIELAYKQGRSPFNSKQFLELVRLGYIRVVGRQGWFEGKISGASKDKCKDGDKRIPWEYSTYHSDFDGVLSGLAQEEKGTSGSVVFAELADDEAKRVANFCVASRNEMYDSCRDSISRKLAPAGLIQKSESPDNELAVWRGIYDSYRHKEIADRLDINVPVEGTLEGAFYSKVAGPLSKQPKIIDKPFSRENFKELVDLHKSVLLKKKEFEDFISLLEKMSENRRYRQLYTDSLFSLNRPVDVFLEELCGNYKKYVDESFRRYIGPLDVQTATFGSLALSACALTQLVPSSDYWRENSSILLSFMFSWVPVEYALEVKRGTRRIPDYSGNKSFYMGRFPNADPTTGKLKTLIEELRDYKG